MKCSKEAHERCLFSYDCTVGETVEDGSDCADFIRAVERDENGEPVGAFSQAEDAYLTEEREAIQQEAKEPAESMTAEDIKKALYLCGVEHNCRGCPLDDTGSCSCVGKIMRMALEYIELLEKGGLLTMALVYDMETVNKAMQEAAKHYKPGKRSSKKIGKVLECFAAMKPVQVKIEENAHWESRPSDPDFVHCSACGEIHDWKFKHCPDCGAWMYGEGVAHG